MAMIDPISIASILSSGVNVCHSIYERIKKTESLNDAICSLEELNLSNESLYDTINEFVKNNVEVKKVIAADLERCYDGFYRSNEFLQQNWDSRNNRLKNTIFGIDDLLSACKRHSARLAQDSVKLNTTLSVYGF